jgi:monooxygenase
MAAFVDVDVLIVGAGLSGVCAGYHLQRSHPGKTYAILEGREQLGGTWDLFRYPGIRSDSDMYTLGYSFRPWTSPYAISDGATILDYIRDTARAYGIDRRIRLGHRVTSARWSSERARWLVEATTPGGTARFSCGFLYLCSGYYNYEHGYTPDFPGRERFRGRIVHPQHWTSDLAYDGQRVIVIGSGATAVTLVPELAKRAAHVTMLQRSPTYIVSVPARDRIANWMRERLPGSAAHGVARWKNVLRNMAFYAYCRRFPEHAAQQLVGWVSGQLAGAADLAHFTPSYRPWDQRVCLVPDGDLFAALRGGRAEIVTDHIETFTESGIALRSGHQLAADLIVTATGLQLLAFGGIALEVDGRAIDPASLMVYRGAMCSDVPNFAFATGYTNASWTLKSELTSRYVCRVLAHMDRHGHRVCVPRRDPSVEQVPVLDFTSGYVLRALDRLPTQGAVTPWRLYQNYALDLGTLGYGRVADGVLAFGGEPGYLNQNRSPSEASIARWVRSRYRL